MKTSYDLVKKLSESFDDSLSNKQSGNRIAAPMIVIYSGTNAAQYDTAIMNAFRQIWLAARAERICRAIREKQGLVPLPEDAVTGDIFSYIETMYQCENVVFHDFSRLTAVILYDARDYTSPDEMIQAYETDVEHYTQKFGQYHTTSVVRMLVVDSARERMSFTKSIRTYLERQNTMGNCKGTFLFSTTLYGGRQESYTQVYDLIGKVIAVGNTDFVQSRYLDVFGFFGDGTIRTVSYTKMERPNTEICAIILRQCLDWWNRYLLTGSPPSEKDIREQLDITDKGYTITDSVYEEVKDKFPPIEALEYFPMNRIGKSMEKVENMQFSTFDTLTMHSFDLFYKQHYLSVIQDESTGEHMRNAARALVQSHIAPPEAMQITDEMLEKIAGWLQKSVRTPLPGQTVGKHIENENKRQIETALGKIILEEIRAQRKLAKQQVQILAAVSQDFHQSVIVDNTNMVADYYEPLVESYLNEYERAFANEVVANARDKQSALEQVGAFVGKMIASRAAFRLAFEEELQERTHDTNGIFHNIRSEIVNHTSQNIFYNAKLAPNALFRVILMNQKKKDGSNTALYEEMRMHLFREENNNYFVDNGNSNGVVALQVYSLSSGAIL